MAKDHKKIKLSVHNEDIRTLAQSLFGFMFSRFSVNYMKHLQDINLCLESKETTDVYEAIERMQESINVLLDEIETSAEILEVLPPLPEKEEEEKKS